jgi:hypothetical protein
LIQINFGVKRFIIVNNLVRSGVIVMVGTERPKASGATGGGSKDFMKAWEAQSDALLGMQQELAEVCEQISNAWAPRLKAEGELWSTLSTKMLAAKSVADAVNIYQQCAAQRMQMAADDGRRLFEDSQRIMSAIARSLSPR